MQLSANEQKWFARIILQDLKIGVREEGVLGFFHERAQELYDTTSDLRYVCAALSEGCVLAWMDGFGWMEGWMDGWMDGVAGKAWVNFT